MTYETRLSLNYVFGTLTSAISASDTTLSSADFARLPAPLSTTAYVPITLQDPSLKVCEIIWANSHTSGSTSITALRGTEASQARSWPAGTLWTLAPSLRDGVLPVSTRTALPTDAHVGLRTCLQDEQLVVERGHNGWIDVDVRTRMIARARRTTSSTTSTGANVGVLRLDKIAVRAGQHYSIRTGALALHSNASGDNMAATFTYTTDSSTPTAASPALPGGNAYAYSTGAFYPPVNLDVQYVPSTDQSLSLLLCVVRVSGTGGCYLVSDAQRFIEVMVLHHGPDVGNTGISV